MPAHLRAPLTLRLRLVGALVALVTIGLSIFMLTMYGLYSRSQYDRLDDQLRASVTLVSAQLRSSAGLDPDGDNHGAAGGPSKGGDGHESPPVS